MVSFHQWQTFFPCGSMPTVKPVKSPSWKLFFSLRNLTENTSKCHPSSGNKALVRLRIYKYNIKRWGWLIIPEFNKGRIPKFQWFSVRFMDALNQNQPSIPPLFLEAAKALSSAVTFGAFARNHGNVCTSKGKLTSEQQQQQQQLFSCHYVTGKNPKLLECWWFDLTHGVNI